MMRAALLLLALSGCSRILGGSSTPEPIPNYPGTPDGLRAFASDVLKAGQRDERQRVHDLLASTIMTDEDLTALFGDAAPALRARYSALMQTLANRGAVELVAQIYEHKYDTVDVIAIDPSAPDARDADRAIARSLKVPLAWYSVRVRKSTEPGGLRYDFFFYRGGHWRTGNQLGKFLGPLDGGAR